MIDTSKLIFKPIIPLSTMIPFTIILLIVVLINRKHIINRILILLLLLIVSQRPMLKDQDDVSYVLNFDVMFVIDTTVSMNATDMSNGTRLDAVKRTANYIIEELPGSKFSIITFDNDAFVKYPFTSDIAVIEDVLKSLKTVDPNYALGSSLSSPSEYMKMLVESAIQADKNHDEKRQRIVFFMSDGELNNEERVKTNLAEYNGLSDMIDNGAIIGIGTPEGGKMQVISSVNMNNLVDSKGYLLDNSVNPPVVAISKMDENNLKAVATKLELDYFKLDSNKISEKIEEIKNMKDEDEDEDEKNDKDIYYYFTFAALILTLYELFYYRRNEL